MSDRRGTDAFVQLLAERAAADPSYLGWAVRAYAEAEGRSLKDVIVQLGMTGRGASDFLVSLRPTGERFAEMLRSICVRFGADEIALVRVLREVEVLEALRGASSAADAGLLMAARMRDGTRRRGFAEDVQIYSNDEDEDDVDHEAEHRPRTNEGDDAG